MTILYIVCIFIVVNQICTVMTFQSFRQTPDNKTTVLGDTVIFYCSINNKTGQLQWTKDGFGLGMAEDVAEKERYAMKISTVSMSFDLEIRDVTLDDEGVFECQVGPGIDGSRRLRSESVWLTVQAPTSNPVIIQGDTLLIAENKDAQLDCISRGGKPAAEVKS